MRQLVGHLALFRHERLKLRLNIREDSVNFSAPTKIELSSDQRRLNLLIHSNQATFGIHVQILLSNALHPL